MNDEELLQAQRLLRGRLLDTRRAIMPGAADLVAHLLLYLDDTDHCWQLSLNWLRAQVDADRVDGGFAVPWGVYLPFAESMRQDLDLPSSVGKAFDPNDSSVRSVWASPQAVVFDDIAHDGRFSAQTRQSLLSLQTGAKLAIALRVRNAPVGLVCCDWVRERRRWKSELVRQVSSLADEVLSPIIAASYRLTGERGASVASAADEASAGASFPALTAGELEVAGLVVTGMSYKEIAVRLNRSFSTVDHRLRAIREKLGARSTARMIVMLSELLAARDAHGPRGLRRAACAVPGAGMRMFAIPNPPAIQETSPVEAGEHSGAPRRTIIGLGT
jgi:DNA-binding CsgD family transcriptional regulator